MTFPTSILGLVFAMLLLVAAGCNQPRGPIEPNAVAYPAAKQVYADSYKLKQQTNIDQPPRMWQDANGLLHVEVPIRSTIDRPFTLQYRMTFFDRGHHVTSQQSWADLPMNPNTPERIEATSATPSEDFEADLRLPPGFDD